MLSTFISSLFQTETIIIRFLGSVFFRQQFLLLLRSPFDLPSPEERIERRFQAPPKTGKAWVDDHQKDKQPENDQDSIYSEAHRRPLLELRIYYILTSSVSQCEPSPAIAPGCELWAISLIRARTALERNGEDFYFRMDVDSGTSGILFRPVQVILKFRDPLLFFLFAEVKTQEKRRRDKYE